MHLNTIDLVYIHNAFESWHGDVSKEEFMNMLTNVFEVYEKYRALNKIHYYGMATWTCFRVDRENTEYSLIRRRSEVCRKSQSWH